jgi:hypothetical protein
MVNPDHIQKHDLSIRICSQACIELKLKGPNRRLPFPPFTKHLHPISLALPTRNPFSEADKKVSDNLMADSSLSIEDGNSGRGGEGMKLKTRSSSGESSSERLKRDHVGGQ